MSQHVNHVMVDLFIQYRCNYDEALYVVGNSNSTGNWDPEKGIRLLWKMGDIWHVRIYLEVREFQKFQYKYVARSPKTNQARWESKENHRLYLERAQINYESLLGSVLQVNDVWDFPEQQRISFIEKKQPRNTAIVVLGKKLLPKGQPTHILVQRMKEATNVFKQVAKESTRPLPLLILSGGPNRESDRFGPTEARVMKDLAVAEGVPVDCIVCETTSLNTIENLISTKEILEDYYVQRVILMTSDFHMKRALALFEKICGPNYQLEYHEDHPNWKSDEERLKEEETERQMMELVPKHLELYFG